MKFLHAALVLSLALSAPALRLCHHNDFHARYAQINRFNSPCSEEDAAEGKCFSSSARLKAAFDHLDCDLRVFAGDFVQGSVYDTIFGVEIAIDMYNAVGYDVATFGNHEFNKGVAPVYETVAGTPNVTWISSNVEFAQAPKGLAVNKYVEADDLCWVAGLTESTVEISNPGPNVTISNVTHALQSAVSMCNSMDNVIAVNHVGYESDIALCESVPELDLVIGGHSHTDLAQGMYPTKVEREDGSVCWVVTAFAFGRYLGFLDVSFDEGALEISGYCYIPMDARVPLDPVVAATIANYTVRLDASIQTVVGVASAPIDGDRSSCRAGECQMGNLVCDAMLAHAGPQQGAVACIQNGGGLRASIDEGDITIEEVLTVLPFGNVHAVVTVPGSTVLAALENGFLALSNEEITGRFPQVAGMEVEVDFSAPDGERVKSVVIAGSPLEPATLYTIVTNSFMATGGDGYEWDGATELELSGRGIDVLTNGYLSANNPYTPVNDGRITELSV